MSSMSNRTFTFLIMGTLLLFAVIMIAANNQMFPWQQGQIVVKGDGDEADDEVNLVKEDPSPGPGFVKVGGIWRRETDLGEPVVPNTKIKEGSLRNPGQSPRVKADLNPQVASVAKALKDKTNPERLTVFKSPKPFDKTSFEKNPDQYINTIEPGRAMQPAQPGPDVNPIRKRSPGIVKVIQGESTTLKVKADQNAFVTFHTTDLGVFNSGIKTVNVRADDKGIAEATYTATKGTIGNVRIVAASPYNSELAQFVVNVSLPEPIAEVEK